MEPNQYIAYLHEFKRMTSDEFARALRVFEVKARSGKLSAAITAKLQTFDMIIQRLQHLVDTHEKVMTLYIGDIFKDSFLHLQYFQFSIIASDLFEVLLFIDQNLNDSSESQSASLPNGTDLQHHATSFAMYADKIKTSLKENSGEVKFFNLPALTKRQIAICRQLYTMERERVVLDWYVNNSTREFSELLQVYQSWLKNYNDPSIELFDNI